MDNRENGKPGNRAGDTKTYTAASVSGASQKREHTLLPMLIGGLVLIVLGMIAVVVLV